MFQIEKRILTHFDFLLILFIIPIISTSYFLVSEANETLGNKQLVYMSVGFISFCIFFLTPIRKIAWLIPFIYWFMILLLLMVDIFGISRLGAQRWLEIPFTHFTIQPSELIKPAFILMLAYKIQNNPPPRDGYGLKDFLNISFYILLPFLLIAKEPDLGTALVLLMVGFGIILVVGVNWRIWTTLAILIGVLSPLIYTHLLHDYQRQRIKDFLGEKPHYHVQQSVIAIGSGGMYGKEKDDATQSQLKFLPISTSDFIFAYYIERFGFMGCLVLISVYAMLIINVFTIGLMSKNDYFLKVFSVGITFMIFIYMSVNIAMTIGYAPVVGLPLPLFSYGGSSFVNFMILFGILENLVAFRYNHLYNNGTILKRKG